MTQILNNWKKTDHYSVLFSPGDDSSSNVRRLCFKGQNPIRADLVEKLGVGHLNITCGAVCVYSSRVPDAKKALADARSNLPIASVAFGFPAGTKNV